MSEATNRFAHLRAAALTDVGRRRKNNEDAFGAFPAQGVWCVADGMGGGDDGEVASAAVVKSVDACLSDLPSPSVGALAGARVAKGVAAAVEEASGWIFRRTKKNGLKGCGSTFVGIVFDATDPRSALVLHVGDSRLYRLRGRDFRQITKDHSVAEMMGAKDEKDLNPMFRGMILRAVGIENSVEIDRTPMSVEEDDVVLICSDGLTRMVPDRRIAEILRDAEVPVEETARRLVAAANEAGGIDNVTVVVVRVGALPSPAPAASADETEELSTSTGQTVDHTMPVARRPRRVVLRRSLFACAAACALLAFGWAVSRPFCREERAKTAATPAPAPVAMPVSELVPSGHAGRVTLPRAPGRSEETALPNGRGERPARPQNPELPVPAEPDAKAVSDAKADRERDEVERELQAERERRREEDAKRAADEREKREAAQALAKMDERDFDAFAAFLNAVFGKGTCDAAGTLVRQLRVRGRDDAAVLFATDFTAEVGRLAERLVAKCRRKSLQQEKAIVALVAQGEAVAGKDPSAPETQRKCRELIEFVAKQREGSHGRK
jgi:PPM family protein phosphatase